MVDSKHYNITGVTFIRNAMRGALCLFESMATMLPYVHDMIVVDVGSDDGTTELLRQIANDNPRIRLECNRWNLQDASELAGIANYGIGLATCDNVLFWQADEVWHEKLLERMVCEFSQGHYDLAFWRYQLKNNFQRMKWLPHPVHRVGPKSDFKFVDDGMNSNRVYGVSMCSGHDMGWFLRWGEIYGNMTDAERAAKLPTHDMILDISKSGGFLDCIIDRAGCHAPMWHEQPNVDGMPIGKWLDEQRRNSDWKERSTPYNIPGIMRYHVGASRYYLRDELHIALREDREYVV